MTDTQHTQIHQMADPALVKTQLFRSRTAIAAEIERVLETFYVTDGHFPLAREFYWQMKEYATSGKLFRGCLLVEMQQALTGRELTQTQYSAAVQVAAGLELICSGLLVHDDIMDQDVRRRGLLTTHTAVTDWATEAELPNATHFGESVAICFGDVLFFLGMQCLNTASVSDAVARRIMQISSHELACLGLAQTEDMRQASLPIAAVTQEEIIEMQYGKTGRYTGRWPLLLAAALAERSSEEQAQLLKIGDEIGLLYQWRDDYLGLFGHPEKTGKNIVSDVREGKKTLWYWYAWHTLAGQDKQLVERVFANPHATLSEVQEVVEQLRDSACTRELTEKMQQRVEKVERMLAKSSLHESAEGLLLAVLKLVIEREK